MIGDNLTVLTGRLTEAGMLGGGGDVFLQGQ